MTGTSGSEPHGRSRIVLTSRTKNAIRETIGSCEYCGALLPPDELEVFQIAMLSGTPARPDENPANAVIVLCREHYEQAKAGTLKKTMLKAKVAKRTDKKKRAMRGLLMKLDRTYDGANIQKYRNPAVFGVGAFMRDRSGRRP